jgi:hypothetical protein
VDAEHQDTADAGNIIDSRMFAERGSAEQQMTCPPCDCMTKASSQKAIHVNTNMCTEGAVKPYVYGEASLTTKVSLNDAKMCATPKTSSPSIALGPSGRLV